MAISQQFEPDAARIFAINEGLNQLLIEHLHPDVWTARPSGKVRSIAAIFTHMHNIRVKWIRLTHVSGLFCNASAKYAQVRGGFFFLNAEVFLHINVGHCAPLLTPAQSSGHYERVCKVSFTGGVLCHGCRFGLGDVLVEFRE